MRKILITGNFNILHPGHMRLFKFAKELGGKLIVAVSSDRLSGGLVNVSEQERLDYVRLTPWVDEAFVYDENLEVLLERIRPDVIVKGREHERKLNEEHSFVKKTGAALVFGSGETSYTSLSLKDLSPASLRARNINSENAFLSRHGVTREQVRRTLNELSELRVLVIGDLILDQYTNCDAVGMSREDPTIVVSPYHTKRYLGGAGIVAAHCAGAGARVDYIGLVGKDIEGEEARGFLDKYRVNFYPIIDTLRPTTLKTRYRAGEKTLLRVNRLVSTELPVELEESHRERILEKIEECDLVILSDFSHGILSRSLVDTIIDFANSKRKVVCADCQSSSQLGDLLKYRNIDLITPTEYEARTTLRNNSDGLVVIAQRLIKLGNFKNLLLKMGSEGVMIHRQTGNNSSDWHTDQVDAINANPIDVSGAGDSMLALSSMTLAVSGNIWLASYIGSLAAGIQVGRLGNLPVTADEIREVLG
jgi:rfaE bifunctional protein kinase chain/domain